MGKKHVKHKSSHKKKHKKEKKKQKERRFKLHRKSSSSSDSDASSDSTSFGDYKSKSQGEPKCFPERIVNAVQDDIGWDNLFSERHTISKKKSEPKKVGYILEKPGQSARELNPYWKDGGNGLPPVNKEGSSKLEKQAEKLKQIIENSENDKFADDIRYVQNCSHLSGRRSKDLTECISRQFNFMKPGEGSGSDFINTYKRNWRKKEEKEYKVIEPGNKKNQSENLNEIEKVVSVEQKSILTPDELNALAAKKIKAEIMGNKALAASLEKEIEFAKKGRQEHFDVGGNKIENNKKEEVVIVRKSILEKLTHPCENDYVVAECSSGKRRRGETHKGNERLRYFMDDDKHSLKSMFEREKLGTTKESDELFIKLAKRGKFRSNNDDNDLDDDFLDRVRCSDYERKERHKERIRSLNEAKANHKSLSHCRWCLDGNNIKKHLIVSVGSKCYLCLPNDKSLTNGHCLIVPVHHDTCGTLVDEDVWNEVLSYRNRLCRMFEDAGQDVVFFENARSLNRFPHMVLHCVPMDKEVGGLAPIYFKKAIMESETEWSNNKKLIDLREKDLRRSVPKGLPYFAIDFGRDGGFAHVIEDEKLFPPNFAEEIIGGMLDLDAVNWRKPRKESLEGQKEKVEQFLKRWKKYEDLKSREKPVPASDSSDSD